MDEMYDDMDGVHSLLTTMPDEDSVDIYSGLDSPSMVAERPSLLSPRLNKAMDLYEEVIAEERQSRDSSHEELKARFQAAHKTIEELRQRLAQMETKNTGLNTENNRLKKNISALLKTARQEVLRKDEEIRRLSMSSGRDYSRYQPRMNGGMDPGSTRMTPSASATSRPPPPEPPRPSSAAPPPLQYPPPPPIQRPAPPPQYPPQPPPHCPPQRPPQCPRQPPPPPSDPPPSPPPPPPPLPPTTSPSRQRRHERSLPEPPGRGTEGSTHRLHSRSSREAVERRADSSVGRSRCGPTSALGELDKPKEPKHSNTFEEKHADSSLGKPRCSSSSAPYELDKLKQPKHGDDQSKNLRTPESTDRRHKDNLVLESDRECRVPVKTRSHRAEKDDLGPSREWNLPEKTRPHRAESKVEGDRQCRTDLPEKTRSLRAVDNTETNRECRTNMPEKTRSLRADKDKMEPDRQCNMPEKTSSHQAKKDNLEPNRECNMSEKTRSHRTEKDKMEPDRQCNISEKTRSHRTEKENPEPNRECNMSEKTRSHRTVKDAEKYDKSHKRKIYTDKELLHRSERPKSSHFEPSVACDLNNTIARNDKSKLAQSVAEHRESSSATAMSQDDNRVRQTVCHSGSTSSDSKERKLSSERSTKQRREASPLRDRRRREERRRGQGDEARQGEHRSSSSGRSREGEKKKRSKERSPDKTKDHRKKKEKSHKGQSEDLKVEERICAEENSPNRKLCFMEKLNLTVSPVKKTSQHTDGSKKDTAPPQELPQADPLDDCDMPNIEEWCVIDEAESSCLEMENPVVEADEPPTTTEMADKECDTKCEEEAPLAVDKVQTESDMVSEQLVDSVHKITSVSTTNDQCTEDVTSNAPDSHSSSKITIENMDLAVDEKVVNSGSLEIPTSLTGDGEGISENNTCNSTENEKTPPQMITESPNVEAVGSAEPIELGSSMETPTTTADTSPPVDTSKEDPVDSCSRVSPVSGATEQVDPEPQHTSPCVLPDVSQQPPPALSNANHEKETCVKDGSKDVDAVSSSVSPEELPKTARVSLDEAIYVFTQMGEDADTTASEPSSSTGCIGVSSVSSTTEEVAPQKVQKSPLKNTPAVTPRKDCSPGKGHLGKEKNTEPSSRSPLLHDEDSMMRMLTSLKHIPDVISPLRSPIQQARRGQPRCPSKPPYVKSLHKEFSSTADDVNSTKLGVNKENKHPSSLKHESHKKADNTSGVPSGLADMELEEGEIVSESEEGASTPSPPMVPETARPTNTDEDSPHSASRSSTKTSSKRVVSKERRGAEAATTESPTSLNRRFKIVCPTASSTPFSTMEEVMTTLKTVRHQMRKKYMKQHKTFPKKTFYGTMDNYHTSFLEFVDGAKLDNLCNQVAELKSKLRNMFNTVFRKLSTQHNGIVNRIFDQQPPNMKQKLWDFVNVQLDYLFQDINDTLVNYCKPTEGTHTASVGNRPGKATTKDRELGKKKKTPKRSPSRVLPNFKSPQKDKQPVQTTMKRITPHFIAPPCKTGLGSRGKDIRMTQVGRDGHPEAQPSTQSLVEFKSIHSTPEKRSRASLVLSQNSSFQDRGDFEILTEQQTSSLTFNLARDSQMGEIFKCLLQGSDLLENSASAGDGTAAWAFGTPRKDSLPGDSLISITTPIKFTSPSKFTTPSKIIARWPSLSPGRMLSAQSKLQHSLNPALFDDNCLLEVPSVSTAMPQSSMAQQRTYSILAEDLAVSLTIPSPLKSDSHLSFLQDCPMTMELISTPESVISAHLSEDAMQDCEDASEQDIHLALDSDNSSCASSGSMAMETLATPLFQFKPHLPMQAVVMENSNEHFILKIRQASADADVTLTADDSLSRTLTEEEAGARETPTPQSVPQAPSSDESSHITTNSSSSLSSDDSSGKTSASSTLPPPVNGSNVPTESSGSKRKSDIPPPELSDSSSDELECSTLSERTLCIVEDLSSTPESSDGKARGARSKRKKHQEKSNPKRVKKEEKVSDDSTRKTKSPSEAHHNLAESSESKQSSNNSASRLSDSAVEEMPCSVVAETTPSKKRKHRQDKSSHKSKRAKKEETGKKVKVSKSPKKKGKKCSTEEKSGDKSPSPPLSPNTLSAKNVIRKKGEVVISWTRDEDRAILLDLKMRGASRETFSALSEKLNKPASQIAERFSQLMKLFKKQGTS